MGFRGSIFTQIDNLKFVNAYQSIYQVNTILYLKFITKTQNSKFS